MRTFEYVKGRSSKFWNIEVKGKTFTITFGRIGTRGQSQTKEFADEPEARAAADKLIAEKLKKGYAETTPAARPVATTPLRQALEAAVIEDPEDPAALAALADYLQEQGDPQGEFIQVQLSLERPDLTAAQRKKLQQREQELLEAHRQEWVGGWADLAPSQGPEGRGQLDFRSPKFGFERGLLSTVTIDELTVQCARAFVAAPQTRFVRRLFVGGWAWEERGDYEPGPDVPEAVPDDDPSQYVLMRWPFFANLRVFQLGWTSDEEYGNFCHLQCHLSGDLAHSFVQKMPHLEELCLFAHGVKTSDFVGLPLPHLRVLQVYHAHDYELEGLAQNGSLSKLTHLLCHPHALEHGDGPYIGLGDLRAVVRSPHLSSLTHLRLRLTTFGDRGCEEIVRSGILRRLKVLDLRHGCISDEGARTLAGCPGLRNLELLDASRNELTADGIRALHTTGIRVLADHQHGPTAGGTSEGSVAETQVLFEGDYE
jgi:uncharacterized protein (TIGR02996 family)